MTFISQDIEIPASILSKSQFYRQIQALSMAQNVLEAHTKDEKLKIVATQLIGQSSL